MSTLNPQVYYENSENHGSYVYRTLEEIVYNFIQGYTGDNTVIGNVERRNVLFWAKLGLKEFTIDALREVKAVELELGDTLDIILPPDYLSYVRVSYVNQKTGELMPLARDLSMPLATAYLQDHNADILFDNDGYILEGTTAFQELNDHPIENQVNQISVLNCGISCSGCAYYSSGCPNPQMFSLDTGKNYNGRFNVDTRQGKMHFGSENASRIIMLEYISDGLEYSNESDIKVNKIAEMALYKWINWNIVSSKIGVQEYIVNRAKKDFDTAYRNTKVKLMNLRPHEVMQTIRQANKWFK